MILSTEEKDFLFRPARRLTGANSEARYEVLVQNVLRRMRQLGASDLGSYLKIAEINDREYGELISALTIHTTSWFREEPHFEAFAHYLNGRYRQSSNETFAFLSAACSTGEELFSFGMLLEYFRRRHPAFQYSLEGWDIDPVSIEKAQTGRFESPHGMTEPWQSLLASMSLATTSHERIVCQDILRRARFSVTDLSKPENWPKRGPYHWIACRNVLIYLQPQQSVKTVQRLAGKLFPSGRLCLGHSEAALGLDAKLRPVSESIFVDHGRPSVTRHEKTKPSVLVIDNSFTARQLLVKGFNARGFQCFEAEDTQAAENIFAEGLDPQVITLDLQMPSENGIAWLRRKRKAGMRKPVFIVSDFSDSEKSAVVESFTEGLTDYFPKSGLRLELDELLDRVQAVVRIAAPPVETAKMQLRQANFHRQKNKFDVILIGASTGGIEAICRLLARLGPGHPPIVVVQHILKNFAKAIAMRIGKAAELKIAEISGPTPLQSGHLYMAPDDVHLTLSKGSNGLRISSDDCLAAQFGQKPSIDVLFRSAARIEGVSFLAILLTGMGKDGAEALLLLKNQGATTLVQDLAECVVPGIPAEAIRLNAAQLVLSIDEMRRFLLLTTNRAHSA
ncbi:MAG TPA: chemotaxis protein CheB [Oligoflexus sp.]|uniref:chemotaxis protein CheB n=1 Tax=Oligoflexus sp. TaxID=1971216 RepID=UPI002D66175A|nr:chemotaxis protein CheB [Oligoflexus sp.]HYX36904.1 chemotaxis protein CheB [Oligoflexus sp.]